MNYGSQLKLIVGNRSSASRLQDEFDLLIRNNSLKPFGIDPRSKNTFELLKKKVKEKIINLEQQLIGSSKREKKDLEARIKELKDALVEFETLEKSDINYRFQIRNEPEFDFRGTKDAKIFYDGTLGSLINELKHAFQFETGEFDIIERGNEFGGGFTFDVYDELETYKRQYAFSGVLKLRFSLLEWNKLKPTINKNIKGFGRVEIKSMKDITVDVILKISDTVKDAPLYDSFSRKKLNINSNAQNVWDANYERRLDDMIFTGFGGADKKKSYIEFVKVFIQDRPIIHAKF